MLLEADQSSEAGMPRSETVALFVAGHCVLGVLFSRRQGRQGESARRRRRKLSTDDIRQRITHPDEAAAKANSIKKPPLPAKYGTLPAADVDALVAYMASLK